MVGDLRFFYRVPGKDLENGLIWYMMKWHQIDNCRKGEEAHVYIEHLVDEPVSLIENVDAEKITSEAVSTVEETNETACDAGPSEKENVDATEDAEKADCESVDQPAEERVNALMVKKQEIVKMILKKQWLDMLEKVLGVILIVNRIQKKTMMI